MNKRTTSILNKSHQHTNKVTHNSSQVGHFPPVVMAGNAQQIKHIGATVGALARQQEDRFQKLEHQLNLLSDKLDDLALNHPRFTSPESSTSSVHEEAEPCLNLPFGKSSDMPRQTLAATVADVGGYFYPNCIQFGHSDEQHISDVSTFVGRVNRTLRTKPINNIEIFLGGSALRWFHIGLRIDGSHIFDHENGELNIAKFCQSLILLFGVPKFSRPESDVEALHLAPASMRSVLLEDYAFPALEQARRQGAVSDFEVALSKAVERYNRNSIPVTVNPDIAKNKDLLSTLVCLRRSEFDQKLDKFLTSKPQRFDNATSARVPIEDTQKAGATGHEVKQDSMSATVNEIHRKKPSLTTTEVLGNPPIAKSDDVRVEIMTELPAARDCYGEKVLNPVEHKQKMLRCINFLADERVEVLSDFEEKLAALKDWLHNNHSHQDSDDEIELLWHRVEYMIWIHEQRIQKDAFQHSTDDQVPDSEFMSQTGNPSNGHQWRLDLNGATTGKVESLKSQVMQAQNEDCILKNRFEEATVAKARIGGLYPLNLRAPKMLERTKPKFAESIEAATEPYPPAPTVVSSPATPVLPCQVPASPLSEAPQMRGFRERLQDIVTMDSSEVGHSIPVSPEIAMKFGLQPDRQPTQQQIRQVQQQMHMQQMAQLQQNAIKRESIIQTNDYPKIAPHQESSVLATDDTSYINPHSFYQSGCATVKNSMERNTTHFELGPLDDQECTNYAHMLNHHAAAVAEESIHEAEVPSHLALPGHKPTWCERKAAKVAGGYEKFPQN
ncbi:hypothetical protein KCU95_g4741, partial [Aureobasidium melanogenum]